VAAQTDTTVVVVHRESFGCTRRTLEHVLPRLDGNPRVICVDGGSPPHVRRALESTAASRGYLLLRSERFLTPNEARNQALPFVDTEFVLFTDFETELPSDVVTVLERTARSSGASIVGPMYLERRGQDIRVHMAGGRNQVVDDGARRTLDEAHLHAGDVLSRLPALDAGPTEQVEFHCMLVRRAVFDDSLLDEGLWSLREHLDLCLQVRDRGGAVWFEPEASATYTYPERMSLSDRAYWLLRWSDEWNERSLDEFGRTWRLATDDPSATVELDWIRAHRWLAYRPLLSVVSRAFGRHRRAVYEWFDPRAQRLVLRWHRRRCARADRAPRMVHAPEWLSQVTVDA